MCLKTFLIIFISNYFYIKLFYCYPETFDYPSLTYVTMWTASMMQWLARHKVHCHSRVMRDLVIAKGQGAAIAHGIPVFDCIYSCKDSAVCVNFIISSWATGLPCAVSTLPCDWRLVKKCLQKLTEHKEHFCAIICVLRLGLRNAR